MTLLWNNVLKADGWFEGLQYDLNPRDRVALKNHHDYRNKKQAQQATPAEVQDMTMCVMEPRIKVIRIRWTWMPH